MKRGGDGGAIITGEEELSIYRRNGKKTVNRKEVVIARKLPRREISIRTPSGGEGDELYGWGKLPNKKCKASEGSLRRKLSHLRGRRKSLQEEHSKGSIQAGGFRKELLKGRTKS